MPDTLLPDEPGHKPELEENIRKATEYNKWKHRFAKAVRTGDVWEDVEDEDEDEDE